MRRSLSVASTASCTLENACVKGEDSGATCTGTKGPPSGKLLSLLAGGFSRSSRGRPVRRSPLAGARPRPWQARAVAPMSRFACARRHRARLPRSRAGQGRSPRAAREANSCWSGSSMALGCCGGEAASADSRLGLSHSSIACKMRFERLEWLRRRDRREGCCPRLAKRPLRMEQAAGSSVPLPVCLASRLSSRRTRNLAGHIPGHSCALRKAGNQCRPRLELRLALEQLV